MLLKNLAVLTSALLLVSCIGTKAQDTSPFPDVPSNHWAFSAVAKLHQNGVLKGYPKEYDNSTPEACWKSLRKAMERRNGRIVRELMSDDAWQILTDQQGSDKMRLEYLRRLAHKIRRREQDKLIEWRPVEPSETGRSASLVVRLYNGTSDMVFSFQKEGKGWKVNSVHTIY